MKTECPHCKALTLEIDGLIDHIEMLQNARDRFDRECERLRKTLASESQREAAESADEKPDGQAENVPTLAHADDIRQTDTIKTLKGKAVSKSLIIDFMADPSAWKATLPKVSTKAMKSGSLLDCLLLTPGDMRSRYAISPFNDFKTNEAKAWRSVQNEKGIEVITSEMMETATAQSNAILAHDAARKLLNGARTQIAFRHKTKYGFDSKGLIDIEPLEADLLVDLKQCSPSALESRRSLQRYIYDWDYHVQAGCYCEGYSIASGHERSRFKFIFVSSKAPFKVAVIELPLPAILLGSDQYRLGLSKFAECMETDHWPSIWDEEQIIDLPEYAYTEGGDQ